jgi:hypothetical protein
MGSKITTAILGWLFLIASFFTNYETNIICASIFFSAHFMIKTSKNNEKWEK